MPEQSQNGQLETSREGKREPMTRSDPNTTLKGTARFSRVTVWLWLSVIAALLSMLGSVTSLAVEHIYAKLTPAFLPQALAQDLANLAVVSPVWLILAVLALRGSLRACLLWLGVLAFTVYNYVIYTLSIPFGPLFLLWVAVFGLSIFALIGGLTAVNHDAVARRFNNERAVAVIAWVLIVSAVLFGLLWLSEDVPALITGRTPQSLTDMAWFTNPVHVLDLGFFIPTVFLSGVLLLRHEPLGYTLVLPCMVFLILTSVPILLTPVVQSVRGELPAWGVTLPIGTYLLILLGALAWLLSTMSPSSNATLNWENRLQ
jgi:hypothetical protein